MTPGPTEEELIDLGIHGWADIAGVYQGADLLLGNGFSIGLSRTFSYDSLFQRFMQGRTAQTQAVLSEFRTSNFEEILEDLGITSNVNKLLGLDARPAAALAKEVREGLISTVKQNHPSYASVSRVRLESIATTLEGFGSIFTLSYDALLYWIIMICIERYQQRQRRFKYNDYFWKEVSDELLQFMDFQHYRDYQHVYYLHGALFLFKATNAESGERLDVKLRSTQGRDLIEAISDELRTGKLPLFVSEGTSIEKQRAIARSAYLNFASTMLKQKRDRMVIYGTSLGANDAHIAEAVRRGTARVAVSIYPGSRAPQEIEREVHLLRAALSGVSVEFFNATTLFT